MIEVPIEESPPTEPPKAVAEPVAEPVAAPVVSSAHVPPALVVEGQYEITLEEDDPPPKKHKARVAKEPKAKAAPKAKPVKEPKEPKAAARPKAAPPKAPRPREREPAVEEQEPLDPFSGMSSVSLMAELLVRKSSRDREDKTRLYRSFFN
mgnify:CR=1 FL=1